MEKDLPTIWAYHNLYNFLSQNCKKVGEASGDSKRLFFYKINDRVKLMRELDKYDEVDSIFYLFKDDKFVNDPRDIKNTINEATGVYIMETACNRTVFKGIREVPCHDTFELIYLKDKEDMTIKEEEDTSDSAIDRMIAFNVKDEDY